MAAALKMHEFARFKSENAFVVRSAGFKANHLISRRSRP